MGIFRRKPRGSFGQVPLGDEKSYTLEPTQAHSVEISKPEVARKTKRRPHAQANQRKPL